MAVFQVQRDQKLDLNERILGLLKEEKKKEKEIMDKLQIAIKLNQANHLRMEAALSAIWHTDQEPVVPDTGLNELQKRIQYRKEHELIESKKDVEMTKKSAGADKAKNPYAGFGSHV